MDQAVTQLAVKILFDASTRFDEMRWTIILLQKQTLYMTWIGISLTFNRNIYQFVFV